MFMAADLNRFPNLIFTRVARPRHSTVRVSWGRNAPCAVRMSKRRSIKSIVKAAVDGVLASGAGVARVDVKAAEVQTTIFTGKSGEAVNVDINPWDEVLTDAAHQERAS